MVVPPADKQDDDVGFPSEFYDPGFDELFAELESPRSPPTLGLYDAAAETRIHEACEKSWRKHAARNN